MSADFAAKVRALSQHRKISQDNLAIILGVTQSRVSQLLRAKEIKLSQAIVLAQLFDVSLDYLADPSIPILSEEELVLERRTHDLIRRLGPDRAYNRLILAERVDVVPPVRPSGLAADGTHVPEKPPLTPMPVVHKSHRKSNQ